MLDVYHWEPNANSGKPILCLKEKGVDYNSHYIDLLNFDQHSPEYLKINPDGTVPAVVHDGLVLTESTPAMEYIDDAFDGPPLRPEDPYERWRMRTWCRFMDTFFAPSLSMIGWSMFMGPMVRQRDPDELKKAIDRIPLPERRRAWSMAIYNTFTEEQLAESRRRVEVGVRYTESILSESPYLAGETYSIADINAMATLYGIPTQRDDVSDETTPHLMDWLRRCHARPAIKAAFATASDRIAERIKEVREYLGVSE